MSKNYPINHEIREKEVRLVSHDGEQLGIMSSKEAMNIAEANNLDLVMISPSANPPVCRVMDYGKFIYEQSKKEKEAKKKQKVVEIKEIRFSPTTEDHDITVKANIARKFLIDGDKVKANIRFRGREVEHSQKGHAIMDAFFKKLEDVGTIEKPAKMEGRNMTMIITSKK